MQLLLKGISFTEKINEQWIKENCYIAGGACVSNFTRQPIHDIDLYFKTKEARDFFIKEIDKDNKYINKNSELWLNLLDYERKLNNKEIKFCEEVVYQNMKITSADETVFDIEEKVNYFEINLNSEYFYDDIYIPFQLLEKQKWLFENGYDYVLADRNHYEVNDKRYLGNKSVTIKHKNGMTYQFILRFCGEPKEVMDTSFDFEHCKIAYDLKTNEYIASQKTWQCLASKEIEYVNSFYPISSLKRLFKYSNRDFKYNNDEFVKIIRDIHKLDVDNKFVIEDQLVGYYEDFDYNLVFDKKYLF